jgi:DNA-binding transcriptional regulator YdaS (Cro superfamily)
VNGVPAKKCPDIERLTDGAVRSEDLNDEVDWAYLRAAKQPEKDSPVAAAKESNEEIRREVDLSYRQPADPKKVAL